MRVLQIKELPRDRLQVNKPWQESYLPPLTVSELWGGAMWNAFKAADMAFDIGANRRLTTFQSLFVKGGLYPEGGLFFQLGKIKELYFPSLEHFHNWVADNLARGMPVYVKGKEGIMGLVAWVEGMIVVLARQSEFGIEGDWMHQSTISDKGKPVALFEGPEKVFITFGQGAYPFIAETGF